MQLTEEFWLEFECLAWLLMQVSISDSLRDEVRPQRRRPRRQDDRQRRLPPVQVRCCPGSVTSVYLLAHSLRVLLMLLRAASDWRSWVKLSPCVTIPVPILNIHNLFSDSASKGMSVDHMRME